MGKTERNDLCKQVESCKMDGEQDALMTPENNDPSISLLSGKFLSSL